MMYTGLDAYTIPVDKIPVLQDKLRILSVCMVFKTTRSYAKVSPGDGHKVTYWSRKNLYEF
jgi:hypothetical protein